jgi:hypothetical protein
MNPVVSSAKGIRKRRALAEFQQSSPPYGLMAPDRIKCMVGYRIEGYVIWRGGGTLMGDEIQYGCIEGDDYC